MTCWTSSSEMRLAIRRPKMSTLLPGPNGTIAVMYLVGHSWAAAAPSCDSISAADTTRRNKLIRWLLGRWKVESLLRYLEPTISGPRPAAELQVLLASILGSPGHHARLRFEQDSSRY